MLEILENSTKKWFIVISASDHYISRIRSDSPQNGAVKVAVTLYGQKFGNESFVLKKVRIRVEKFRSFGSKRSNSEEVILKSTQYILSDCWNIVDWKDENQSKMVRIEIFTEIVKMVEHGEIFDSDAPNRFQIRRYYLIFQISPMQKWVIMVKFCQIDSKWCRFIKIDRSD